MIEFGREPESVSDLLIVTVPAGIATTDDLFEALYERLRLPGYFGFNWNALQDCLTDLHWVSERDIVLCHQDVPSLPEVDLSEYVDVLNAASSSWQQGENHSFRAIFPIGCEAFVRLIIQKRKAR